eukprot:scaffold6931_cov119-Isochrysis_galbana.AAC.2
MALASCINGEEVSFSKKPGSSAWSDAAVGGGGGGGSGEAWKDVVAPCCLACCLSSAGVLAGALFCFLFFPDSPAVDLRRCTSSQIRRMFCSRVWSSCW